MGSALGPGIFHRLLTQVWAVGLHAAEEGLSVFSGFCSWETCMWRNAGRSPGTSEDSWDMFIAWLCEDSSTIIKMRHFIFFKYVWRTFHYFSLFHLLLNKKEYSIFFILCSFHNQATNLSDISKIIRAGNYLVKTEICIYTYVLF